MKSFRRMKALCKVSVFLLIASLWACSVLASHNRGGYITYAQTGPLTFEFDVTVFVNATSPSFRTELEIQYGDGSVDTIPLIESLNEEIGEGIIAAHFIGSHTYESAGQFFVCVTDPNWSAGILNVTDALNQPMILGAMVFISAFGLNTSAQFNAPPIFTVRAGEHVSINLGVTDPDADKLSFALVPGNAPCGQLNGFSFPAGLSLNQEHGELIWDVPPMIGDYVIAMEVTECRNGTTLGVTAVSMAISVSSSGSSIDFSELSGFDQSTDDLLFLDIDPATGGSFSFMSSCSTPASMSAFLYSSDPLVNNLQLTKDSIDSQTVLFSGIVQAVDLPCQPIIGSIRVADLVGGAASDLPVIFRSTQNISYCDMLCGILEVEHQAHIEFSHYPNPSNGLIHLSFKEEIDTEGLMLEIFGVDGRKVQVTVRKMGHAVDVELIGAPKGLYSIHGINNGQRSFTAKVILH